MLVRLQNVRESDGDDRIVSRLVILRDWRDLRLAEAVERLEAMVDLSVQRRERTWGGLRTFAPDGLPVIGFDPDATGFFWLAGQGGYGI